MAFINMGKIDKNIIPILVGSVICFLNRLINDYDGTELFKHSIIVNIIIAFSKLFTVIPFLMEKRSSNKISNSYIKNINTINNIELIYTYNSIDSIVIIKGKIIYIFLSALIFFAQSIIFVQSLKIKTNSWIWDILITSIFYYFIFKIKLYKHHYLSMIIIIITGLIIDLVLQNLQNDITNNLFLLFLRFLREILYSLHDVINKYLMQNKYCSIYDISLSNGIITLILLGIFSIFNYYFFNLDNFEEYFINFNTKIELLVIFGVMITQLGLYLCTLITNRNYTPCHIFIIFVFGQLAYYIDFSINSLIVFFCLLVILFMSLIFNEIIEINFWGLSDNTRRNIIKRGENEESNIYKIDTFDENDENSENLGEWNNIIKNDDIYN